MDILDKIQGMYSKFSPKEKQIGQYILQKNNEIHNMNIQEMADATSVSPATITRFCRKIGCDSFVEMKIMLSASQQDTTPINKESTYDGVHSFYNRAIERTKRSLDLDLIDQIIKELEKANRIYINGVGSSGLTALELAQRLVRMGFNASANTDSHLIIINSTLVKEDDLVIGISSSGSTPEILDAFRIAKMNGAKIIAITSIPDSDIVSLSDIQLISYNSHFVEDRLFINTQFTIMYLLDIISLRLLEDEQRSYIMSQTVDAILKRDK